MIEVLNQDYAEILRAFTEGGVRFLLVGAYAMGIHGYPRATGDIDLFVEPAQENARRTYAALARFGAPLLEIDERTFADDEIVFQIGAAPKRIDIVTSIDGVRFEEAYRDRVVVQIDALEVPCISRSHLIQNKRSTGRRQDQLDADKLAES